MSQRQQLANNVLILVITSRSANGRPQGTPLRASRWALLQWGAHLTTLCPPGAYWCRRPTAVRRMESRFSTHYRKLNLPQRCPAVPKYPELLSALSKRNLAPSYREMELLSKQLPCQLIAFIGYRCPANSEYLGEHINANSDI